MTKSNDSQDFGDFSEVLAEDRVIDAIGRGERIDDGAAHPLYALLSSARAEADANMPAPPVLADLLEQDASTGPVAAATTAGGGASVTSLAQQRRRKIGRHAVTAGGVSITSMLLAGGVAAALAVGGLGYAAYKGAIPLPVPNKDATIQAEEQVPSSELLPDGSRAASATDEGKSKESSAAADDKRDKKEREERSSETSRDEQSPESEESGSHEVEPSDETAPSEPATEDAAPVIPEDAQVLADGGVPAEPRSGMESLTTNGNGTAGADGPILMDGPAAPAAGAPDPIGEPDTPSAPDGSTESASETSTTSNPPAVPAPPNFNNVPVPNPGTGGDASGSTDTR